MEVRNPIAQLNGYQPIIEDGRGIFPEDVRFRAARGLREAIAKAAELDNTTQAEWTRQALLRCLEPKGVRLSRGTVQVVNGGE